MATVARRLLTNFSKGELDPLLEGRPDLAAYFEGASRLENWKLLRQGGVTRRPGLRKIVEVKDSTKDTVLLAFEADVNDTFIIELGDGYARFIKDKAQILTGIAPYEVVSPYTEAQLRNVHYTESVDVLFTFHPDVPQQNFNRLADADWTVTPVVYNPPPSFEADTSISATTATLTPGATTGSSVIFTASSAVFLQGDIGRTIVYGTSRAIIRAFGASAGDVASPNDQVRADIIDAFPNTNPIDPSAWILRLSPQATLDPDIKAPEGASVALVAGTPAFRAADVGKFITIYGGLVRIDFVDDSTHARGTILSEMTGTDNADPSAAPAGAWTLEVKSWSAETGYPRTGEFYQGRLGQASTRRQKTAFWLSATDDFTNYATGIEADKAIEYTIASRALNRIEGIADNVDMFVFTSGSEIRVRSGKSDEPLGGDKVPLVETTTVNGSAPIQPKTINKKVVFVGRTFRQIFVEAFNLEQDGFDTVELTDFASHITGDDGIRLGQVAYAKRLDPILYFVRNDGQLIALTYSDKEKVIGFTRFVTDGFFESVAAVSGPVGDHVYVIVRRLVNGIYKRYIELFEDDAAEAAGRAWTSLQTDSASAFAIIPSISPTVFTGLDHLEGVLVDIVVDGNFVAPQIVSGGTVTLAQPATQSVEIGRHYDSPGATMRPAVEGTMVEGLMRSWQDLWLRVHKTKGGRINGVEVEWEPQLLPQTLFTGDRKVNPPGVSLDGRVIFEQHLPYPMTVLAIFGGIVFSEHG